MTHHHQFDGYSPREPAYDEMFAGTGDPRTAYKQLVDTFGDMSERDLTARVEALHSSYLDQGSPSTSAARSAPFRSTSFRGSSRLSSGLGSMQVCSNG